MPEMADSTSPLMTAVLAFTCTETRRIRLCWMVVNTAKMGTMAKTARASSQRMVHMTQKAPMRVTQEIKRSSGPWWESSPISKRSVVMRLMSWPVRFWSKKENDRVCIWSKRSRRISASTLTPMRWPQ